MASMFKRGFKAVTEEKQRQEENRSKGGQLWKFFLKDDGDEADITFLTDQPISYYEHTIKSFKNGKEVYDSIPCIGEGCKHCANGDKTTFKSAWLVVDHRENSYTDKEGKKQTSTDNVRLFVYGTKIASQLDRISTKYGLLNRTMTMIRMGKGTSTTYTFERGDVVSLTKNDIEELLPESVRDLYEGTTDSLYTILEKQIMALANLEDSDDEPVKDNTLVSLDDDDEDEEEEVKPKSKFAKKSKFGKRETSVKTQTSVKRFLKK